MSQVADSAERAPRADSVRNRARVLAAAEEVFGSEGIAAPVDRIAERAGVGVGTIYRHFPTKEALFEAIVLSHLEQLVADARAAAGAEDPEAALFGFLRQLVQLGSRKRDLADALADADIDIWAAGAELKAELAEAIGHLLGRAQQGGAVRDDISVADLSGLVAAVCMTREEHAGVAPAPLVMLDVVCEGLRRRP